MKRSKNQVVNVTLEVLKFGMKEIELADERKAGELRK
jgi:hypothetical protein